MDFVTNVFGDMAQMPAGRMLKELMLVDVRDVLTMAENTGVVLQPGCLVLKPGAAVNRFVFAQNSASFIETPADTDFGVMYDQAVVWNISNVKQEVFLGWFAKNRYVRFVVLMRDGNDNCLMAGTLQVGLVLSIGKTVADKIAISCVMAAQNNAAAASVATVDPTVLFADTDFGVDFSLDFNA